MEKYDRDNYYHSGLGSENRRDWDRSSRDGDFGRDYENRFRSNSDRNEEYRRRERDMHQSESSNSGWQSGNSDDVRRGYGVSRLGGYGSRHDDTDYVARMERDKELLQQKGYGSGRLGGYSGSAFGGSNYSSHGDFGGSSDYNNMSGGGGNVDDYVSMSGYGGGRGTSSTHSDRGIPNYSGRGTGNEYGYDSMRTGMGSTDSGQNYGTSNRGDSWNRGSSGFNSAHNVEPETHYRSFGTGNTSVYDRRNSDRGGYENYDPNNRWNNS